MAMLNSRRPNSVDSSIGTGRDVKSIFGLPQAKHRMLNVASTSTLSDGNWQPSLPYSGPNVHQNFGFRIVLPTSSTGEDFSVLP